MQSLSGLWQDSAEPRFSREQIAVTRQKSGVLFVRCTDAEAAKIRKAAKLERRTIGGYILNAVLPRLEYREKLLLTSLAPRRPAARAA